MDNDQKPVMIVIAGDPGGARALVPVIEILNRDNRLGITVLAYNEAVRIFSSAGFNPVQVPVSITIETAGEMMAAQSAGLLFTATSNNMACLEKKYIAAANVRNIPVLSIVDFWSNYIQRFCDPREDLTILPDRIAVMDDHAKDSMIACGFPPDRLIVTGQPAFDALARCQGPIPREEADAIRSQLGVPQGSFFILFVSQPLSMLYGDDTRVKGHMGYTEKIVIPGLIRALDSIAKEQNQDITLVIRPHPREDPENYRRFRGESIRIRVSADGDARAVVRSADIVAGMCTELLVEACYLGCIVASIQPDLRCEDMLPTNYSGLSRAVYSIEEIKPVLEEVLFDNECRQKIRENLRAFRPDGRSASNVANLVYEILMMK